MLHLHHSNRLEALADRWLDLLEAAPGGASALFAPVPVIVPSAAVERWLTLRLADRAGIAAGIECSFLAQWLWRQIAAWLPEIGGESPFAPDVLAWRIHAAFGDAAWRAPHPRLAGYLAQADDVMRLDLAGRVARLYDQYLTYRPDWLAWWRDGSQGPAPRGLDVLSAAAAEDAAWQGALWRRLSQELGAAPRHPVERFAEALQRATPEQVRAAGLPAQVHLVALPAIPPLYLGLLQSLAAWTELHVHVLNPCREYWFEIVDARQLARLQSLGRAEHHETAHRALAGWGRQTQATVAQLVEIAGDTALDDEHWVEPEATTLLARWQRSVLDLAELAPGSVTLADDDRSLEAHVGHSAVRELEVLHDTLLDLFAQPDAPPPGEVLVVTPDLEALAPLVDAVFGTVPAERRIPYTITGRGRSRVNGAAAALLELLALLDSRMPVSGVMALLQRPMVARRFGFDDDALATLHRWLRAADVHWALDAEHRGAQGVPATARHTLADGLERLFLGYALPVDAAAPFAGRLPAGDAEGSEAAVLGAFWSFVDALAALRQRVAVPPAPARWPGLLAAAIARFLQPAPGVADDVDDLRELQAAVQALADRWAAADHADSVPLDVLRSALAAELDDPARGGVPSGAVAFSSMASLRGVPRRVIALIGLNDGAFPTPTRPSEFDLMALAPRRGDRQRRHDERNLFLDLLLAARDRVILSWTGRSVRDNAPLPPSVLVAEWLDQLVPVIADDPADAASLRAARTRLVVEHPLQAWSPEAFRSGATADESTPPDPRLRSHDAELAAALRAAAAARAAAAERRASLPPPRCDAEPAPAADASDDESTTEPGDVEGEGEAEAERDADLGPALPFFTRPLPAPPPELRAWTLDALLRWARNPCRMLLQTRLGLALADDEAPLDDDEPLVPDGLAAYRLAERLLPPWLAGADDAKIDALAAAGTEFPDGAFGDKARERALASLRSHASRVRGATAEACLPAHSAVVTLDVDGADWRVQAAWADLRPTGLVRHRYGVRSSHDVLAAWLHHLLLCAAPPPGGGPQPTRWITLDAPMLFAPSETPRAHLADLLRLLRRTLCEPLPFLPKSAWRYVATGSFAKARAVWQGSDLPGLQRRGEREDAAYRLAFRGRPDPFDDPAFATLAEAVFAPVLAHLIEGGP